MKKKFIRSLVVLSAVGSGLMTLAEDAARTFPFPMEGRGLWRIRESFRPAGEDGFISAKGENFVDGKGEVRRFLGVNFYGPAQMPQKADAEQRAKTLAFWGFNSVRAMPQYTWQCRPDGDFSKGPDPELL